MATKLDKALKREISIDGKPFVVTISPKGFKLVGKGRRKVLEIGWQSLTSGEAALATALQASVNPKLNLEPGKAAAPSKKTDKSRNGRRRKQ